ncbi:MAG: 3-deoxy-8-phosphooctulonate synthase [Spirochaetes bacterium]|nr:3-deoxy-8-phosphooctulonate synthase [Spirochaetota bacterium]
MKKLLFIGGPCVIEDEKMLYHTAETLKDICHDLNIPFIFKASYDKANRTSIESYRGPGLEKGLSILKKLKKDIPVELLVDVHCPQDVGKVSEVADIIQIPAFLCRQTDLLLAAGKTGRKINIKKGQFISPHAVQYIIEKVESTGNKKILITERGTCFGYGRLVVDFSGIPVMKKFGYPIIFDATHSVQMPSVGENRTGGMREVVPALIRASIGAGVDGLFMEIHPEPSKAQSDASSQWPLSDVKTIIKEALKIREVICKNG